MFLDPAEADRFRAYHDDLAQPRIVDRRVNMSDLRRANPDRSLSGVAV
jgi:hypothetical protein